MLNNSYYVHVIRVPFFILCYQIKIVTVYHSEIYRNLLLYFLIFFLIKSFCFYQAFSKYTYTEHYRTIV